MVKATITVEVEVTEYDSDLLDKLPELAYSRLNVGAIHVTKTTISKPCPNGYTDQEHETGTCTCFGHEVVFHPNTGYTAKSGFIG